MLVPFVGLTQTDTLSTKDVHTNGCIKLSIGTYLHAVSLIFTTDGLQKSTNRDPFIMVNVVALQFDIAGLVQLHQYRKAKRKYKLIKYE